MKQSRKKNSQIRGNQSSSSLKKFPKNPQQRHPFAVEEETNFTVWPKVWPKSTAGKSPSQLLNSASLAAFSITFDPGSHILTCFLPFFRLGGLCCRLVFCLINRIFPHPQNALKNHHHRLRPLPPSSLHQSPPLRSPPLTLSQRWLIPSVTRLSQRPRPGLTSIALLFNPFIQPPPSLPPSLPPSIHPSLCRVLSR